MVKVFVVTSTLWDWFHKIILLKSFILNNLVSYLQEKVIEYDTEGTIGNKNLDLWSLSVIVSSLVDAWTVLSRENEKGK
jgi:hypothetical protein